MTRTKTNTQISTKNTEHQDETDIQNVYFFLFMIS